MLRATVTYSSNLVAFTKIEVEMSHLASALNQQSGMQAQFQLLDQENRTKIICKGFLDSYAPWSERPVAQTLRVFHALYTDWFQSIPDFLEEGDIASLQVSITYSPDGTTEIPITTMSLVKEPGSVATYSLQRSVDGAAFWPLEITGEAAVPLSLTLKLLAFENSARIDYSTFPLAPQVVARTDQDRRRTVALVDVPHYAMTAFQAYLASVGSYPQGDSHVPYGQWLSFLQS